MTKEEARQMLEDYLNGCQVITLPIVDVKIPRIDSPPPVIATTLAEGEALADRPPTITQYSFVGLLKIAYDL